MTAVCVVPVCDRPVRARGWCAAHYVRWVKTGDPGNQPVKLYATAEPWRKCSVEGCESPASGLVYCHMHNERLRRTGTVEPRAMRLCTVEGCGRKHSGRGFCSFHLRRAANGVPLTAGRYGIIERACQVEGCARQSATRTGYCRAHYERVKRLGAPGPAEIRPCNRPQADECVVESCIRQPISRDMCNLHYKRWLRGAPLTEPARATVFQIQSAIRCSEDGCENAARSRGLCQAHYHQQRRVERRAAS